MSYLRDYLEYATGNEAPELFHVWSAYTSLSAAISRKVWLPFGKRALFPNIYTLLVGDAGNGKSIAMYFCKLLLSHLGDVPISGNIETPPGLWRFMGGNPKADPPISSPVMFMARWPDGQIRECHPMTILANEFIDFISIDDSGWINALNNIYDEDVYRYRTKNMGEDILLGPYIVMLGGLTTDVAHDLQKARIISTGLARRTIFQYGERKWHDPHAILTETPEQVAAFDRCLTYLKKLRVPKFCGAFTWSADTQEWWVNWYNDHNSQVLAQSPQTRSWFASKPDQVLKIGMLTSLSEGQDLCLKIDHLQCAVDYLAALEVDLYKVFGGVGRNELAGVAVSIFDYIAAQTDPVSKAHVKTNFFSMCKPPTEFEDCIRYLIDSGKVVEATVGLGNVIDTILATPEAMKRFAGLRAVSVLPSAVAVSALLRDLMTGAGPSVGQNATPESSVTAVTPTAAESLGESLVGQLPKVQKETN